MRLIYWEFDLSIGKGEFCCLVEPNLERRFLSKMNELVSPIDLAQ